MCLIYIEIESEFAKKERIRFLLFVFGSNFILANDKLKNSIL